MLNKMLRRVTVYAIAAVIMVFYAVIAIMGKFMTGITNLLKYINKA